MPASFAVAGSGDDSFGHLALSPALLYRFLDDTDQRWVPYVGLGLRLGVMVAGRHLLGRPVTGVPTADTCSRRNRSATSTPIEDCAFTISPEPMGDHTSAFFLDFAATYSFSRHLSEGLVSRVHLVQLYVGPRFCSSRGGLGPDFLARRGDGLGGHGVAPSHSVRRVGLAFRARASAPRAGR
jgi:hypothetical protein